MDRRTNESTMDFVYDNGTGPVNHDSPWLKHTAQQLQPTDNLAKKRPHSDLNSPTKSTNFPSLREPTSTSMHFFSQPSPSKPSPSKPLPPRPMSSNPAFSTPRKFEQPNYDSSEIDASSPEYNADSDATPDKMGFKGGLAKASSAITRILTPEKRNPALMRLTNGVSGRGEIAKIPYSHKAENKIKKKRSRALVRRKGSNDPWSGDEDERTTANKKQKTSGPGRIASIFSFIETHPGLPHILSFYAQLLLNVFLVFFFIYLIYSFWATIRADVDKKSEEAILSIMTEMEACTESWKANKCDRDTRAPALESVCNNWERCMNKDARAVGRARVSAHTFAEIFNSFIEPISWKAMIFMMALIFGSVGISNFAFGFFRNKSHGPPPSPDYMPTPQRRVSGPQDYAWSVYQTPQRYGEHAGMMMDNGSPMRRIHY